MPTDTEITAKVEARNAADVVHHLASDEAVRFQGHAALAFWRRLLENVCAVLPPEYHPTRVVEKGPLAAMTDEEARAFERETVPFGKYLGDLVGNVPLSYFDWLEGERDFRQDVKRYLRNPGIQRELYRGDE